MIVWPVSLPCYPQQGTWTETAQPNVATFKPELGAPKYRRRSTASGSTAACTFYFNRDQIETFLAFFEDDLKDGSLPFVWKHPLRETMATWCFENEPEIVEVTHVAYNVSVQLRRLP